MSLASGGSPTLGAALDDCAMTGVASAAAIAIADVRCTKWMSKVLTAILPRAVAFCSAVPGLLPGAARWRNHSLGARRRKAAATDNHCRGSPRLASALRRRQYRGGMAIARPVHWRQN